jgi:hypothetical protein
MLQVESAGVAGQVENLESGDALAVFEDSSAPLALKTRWFSVRKMQP